MANSKGIGNSYEREFSYALSEWITGEPGTSICWRDKSSGGRHTVRNRAGQQTSGSGGDIYPTDSRYEYWFSKFYIDTKNYKSINWVFGNPKNQKSNEILLQWLKTISQCPTDKMPMMPCKIRNRNTPECIIFPIETECNAMATMEHHFVTRVDLQVALNKKEKLLIPKGKFLEFKVVLTEEFFKENNHTQFYERNLKYVNPHNRTYTQGLKL